MAILLDLVVLAAVLVVVALGAFFISSRITINGRMKHWSGETISAGESQRRHRLTQVLRVTSGVCLLLLAADTIAIFTCLNYAANR